MQKLQVSHRLPERVESTIDRHVRSQLHCGVESPWHRRHPSRIHGQVDAPVHIQDGEIRTHLIIAIVAAEHVHTRCSIYAAPCTKSVPASNRGPRKHGVRYRLKRAASFSRHLVPLRTAVGDIQTTNFIDGQRIVGNRCLATMDQHGSAAIHLGGRMLGASRRSALCIRLIHPDTAVDVKNEEAARDLSSFSINATEDSNPSTTADCASRGSDEAPWRRASTNRLPLCLQPLLRLHGRPQAEGCQSLVQSWHSK
mmetsp:Transcript_8225/g.30048  ORF Transcript_8225/g.30048 Transcript_8225/m.30048 type:complete len:254 (-) Transcript_8225:681-1442(-)